MNWDNIQNATFFSKFPKEVGTSHNFIWILNCFVYQNYFTLKPSFPYKFTEKTKFSMQPHFALLGLVYRTETL